MKTKSIIPAILIIILVQSCSVVSFYPLYTKDTLIENDQIIGIWENSSDEYIWKISQPDTLKSTPVSTGNHNWANNKYSYIAQVYADDEPDDWTKFMIHIVKLGHYTYADIFPISWSFKNDILMAHMVPVHSFARINFNPVVSVTWMEQDWLEELIRQNKIRIPYVEDNDGKTLLLSKPEELQKFLIKYENDEDAFSDDLTWELTRINEESKNSDRF